MIYNRLREGIPLGIDATSRYEAELAGRDREDIDFESDSPYNTRQVAGLPPTPIASPGRASIEAALEPADGPWIYYVLEDADGQPLLHRQLQRVPAGQGAVRRPRPRAAADPVPEGMSGASRATRARPA